MSKYKVLIVDDDTSFLEELGSVLTEKGYDVASVADGPSVIRTADETHPDIILLDMKLNGISGFQIANDLRHFLSTKNIPIIGMTGFFTESLHMTFMRSLGITECFIKPFDPADIVKRMQQVLDRTLVAKV